MPAPARPVRTFRDDAVVAERYRIVRFISAGGMGEVYEAIDDELGRHVALKTLRADGNVSDDVIKRFRREIKLAQEVTHPNVCRVFDLGLHRPADGPAIMFLTMELVDGETLAERLKRDGRMAPAAALPILQQMAAGLASAHDAGVVHRDFKSHNVMVAGARTVVTDFGLARGGRAGDALSTHAGVVGTPAYMAPEQVEGGEITAAADVYAFGVVMYEMVTGELPFTGEDVISTAAKRLTQPPPSPRSKVPDLPPAWDALILRCLARKPADRPATARALEAELARLDAPARRRRLPFVLGAAGVALAGAVAFVLLRPQPGPPPAHIIGTPTVAVLGFKNLAASAETAWLSTALGELLSAELGRDDTLHVTPAESVGRTRKALGLADADSFAPDTLRKLKASLGAGHVLVGSYLATGGKLRIDVHLQDATTGASVARASTSGKEEELAELSRDLAAQLRQALGQKPAPAPPPIAVLPQGVGATRLYADGLSFLRNFECQRARDLLERAVALDATFAPAHGALSESLLCLGYDDAARHAVTRALELAAELPAAETLRLRAQLHRINLNWRAALEIDKQRFAARPDDLDAGLELLDGLLNLGNMDEASQLVTRLRALPGGDSLRVELAELNLMSRRGTMADQIVERSQRALLRARAEGAAALVPTFLGLEASARIQRGEHDTGRAQLREAASAAQALGDRDGVCWMLFQLGGLEFGVGSIDEGDRLSREMLAIQKDLGSYKSRIHAYRGLVATRWMKVDLPGFENVLAEARADLASAPTGVPPSIEPMSSGVLAYMRGDLSRSRAQLEAAVAQLLIKSGMGMLVPARTFLAETLLHLDDLVASRSLLETALVQVYGDDDRGPVYQIYSLVAMADGKLDEAETKTRAAVAITKRTGPRALEALVTAQLARILLDRGRADEARAAAEAASKLFDDTRPLWTMQARVHVARVLGQAPELAMLAARAHELGWVPMELEARLALAELDRKLAPTLAREARKRGFRNIARRADAL